MKHVLIISNNYILQKKQAIQENLITDIREKQAMQANIIKQFFDIVNSEGV